MNANNSNVDAVSIELQDFPDFDYQGLKPSFHVLRQGERKLGFSGAMQSIAHPEIAMYGPLGLDQECRGKGYGARLMKTTLAFLKEAGVKAVYVGSGNLPACFTYQKAGFDYIFPTSQKCSNYSFGVSDYRAISRKGEYACFVSVMDHVDGLAPVMFLRNMLNGGSGVEFERNFFDAKGPLEIRKLKSGDYVELQMLLNRDYPFVVRNYSLNLFDIEPFIDSQMKVLLSILDDKKMRGYRYFNINGSIVCLLAVQGGVPVGFGSLAGPLTYERVYAKTGAGTVDMLFHPEHADSDNYGKLFDELVGISRNLDNPKELRKLKVYLTPDDSRLDFYLARGFVLEACLKKEVRDHDLLVLTRMN